MAKHFGSDQWRSWLVEFEQGNLTVARFCDSIGVSVQSFYKWRKKLQSSTSECFVPIVVQSPRHTSLVEIELPGGAIARVPNDAVSLRPILSVLLDWETAQ